MKALDRLLLGTGLLIPVWLFIGVWLTARGYPGYDHLQQAMSQLGATGAPTHDISPWVNNIPLAILFGLFAWGLARRWHTSKLAKASAVLVLLHGLGSLGTGLFACDQGCAPAAPSVSQHVHNLSGLLMFVSLTLAALLWISLGRRLAQSRGLALWSLLCSVLAVVTVVLMAKAAQDGAMFGLYQRLNYAAAVLWVAGLAWVSRRPAAPGRVQFANA